MSSMIRGRSLVRTARHCILLSLLISAVGWSGWVRATEGDIFARGVEYNTVTYSPHPSMCGTPVDINIQGTSGNGDEGTSLFAPDDGKIEAVESTTGWGNYIYWISDSGEKLFLAHLKQINKTGRVYGGEKIGELGNSGCPWNVPEGADPCSSHLHIERCDCGRKLELSGKTITATTKQSVSCPYKSKGQIKRFFYVMEPARKFFPEKDYGIGWWPSDVPCVDATEWTRDRMSLLNTDNSICQEAFDVLADRYWSRDGTYDNWHKIFFEEFDPSYLQCVAR